MYVRMYVCMYVCLYVCRETERVLVCMFRYAELQAQTYVYTSTSWIDR